jgi:hypothetical protein
MARKQTRPLPSSGVKLDGGISSPSKSEHPGSGMGIIYGIAWGFRIGSNYSPVGIYVGLTTGSAEDRFRGHLKKAKKLNYSIGKVNGKKRSVITGTSQKDKLTDDDEHETRLFHTALRTSMGPTSKNVNPSKEYRFLTVLAEVNLFDMGATERYFIKKHNSFSKSFQGKSYTEIIDQYQNRSKIGFNSTIGNSEGSIMKSGRGVDGYLLTQAAVKFIEGGRGSIQSPRLPSLRSKIKLPLSKDLAINVRQVLEYFAPEGRGYKNHLEKNLVPTAGVETIDQLGKPKSLVRNDSSTSIDKIKEYLNTMGYFYNEGTTTINQGARSPLVELFVKDAPEITAVVSKENKSAFASLLKSNKFAEEGILILQLITSGNSKLAQVKLKELMKRHPGIFYSKTFNTFQKTLRQEFNDPDFTLPPEFINKMQSKSVNAFLNDLEVNNYIKEKGFTEEQINKAKEKTNRKVGLVEPIKFT